MSTSARKTVLYVEDHPVNVLLMSGIVERRPDIDLVVATTGQEALRMADGLHPDLLLLDLGLPDCHGSQLLNWLRALPCCQAAPAIAVTADVTFDIAGTGFCELWTKPLYVDRVLARLDALIGTAPDRKPELPTGLQAQPRLFASLAPSY